MSHVKTILITATRGGAVATAVVRRFGSWDNVTGKPVTFPPEAHTHTLAAITDAGTAAAADAGDFATATQGSTADSALQAAAIALMVESDVTGVSGADAIANIMSLTQAEYDDPEHTPAANTLYVIV